MVIRSTVPPGTVDDVVLPALAEGLAAMPMTAGAAMCPEFLREGSGIDDFYHAPFLVVGTGDAAVGRAVTELFGFLSQEPRVVETRTAEALINEVVDRVVARDARSVALLGLSFKANTDDLRESPNVELAERLLGKGFDVRIYDPIVNPDSLVGANRRHVESKLPHLGRLLHREPGEVLAGSDVAIVSSGQTQVVAALLAAPPPRVIDLSGRLAGAVEALPGYEGIGW